MNKLTIPYFYNMYKDNTYTFIFLSLILLLSGNFCFAQLGFCGGNSGDPIFTETFGTGTNYGPSLPAGTTTYSFVAFDGPQDGQYTVGSNTFQYGWNMPSDHTPGDTNGKALIVNASFTSGEFYKTTITGLCEDTTYEFSSWLLNILPSTGCSGNGIPVNVRFEIWDSSDTILLASGDTGNIFGSITPNWQEYGLVFTTTTSQFSVILKMINNGVGGCGNDLAIDDIVFKTCGDFIFVEDSSANTSVSVCASQIPYSTTLEAIPDFSVFNSHFYQWQESFDGNNWIDIVGETNETYQVNNVIATRYYRVKVAESSINLVNDSCNTISEVFAILVQPDVSQPASNGDVLFNCDINQAILSVSVPNGFIVNWYDSPINGTLLQANNPVYFTTSETGTFFAEAENILSGCKSQTRTAVSFSRIDPDPPISNGDVEFNCVTNQAELSVTVPNGITVDWYDSPIGGVLLQADSSNFSTTNENATFYAEALNTTTGCISQTRTPISVSINRPSEPISNGNVEFNCSTNEAELTVTVSSGVSVNWYDNVGSLLLSDSPTYTATSIGFYFAESEILSSGCTSINRVQIEVFGTNPNPPISNGDVDVSCNTSTGVLSVSVLSGVRVDWFDSAQGGTVLQSNSTTYTTNIPGTYFAEAFDEVTNCKSLSRTAVSLVAGNEFPEVEDEFLTFCEDETIILDANISNVTYLWNTGETTRLIEVDMAGTYTVLVTDSNNCSSTKTIELAQINSPVIETVNSNGFQIEISTTEPGNFEYSLDDMFYQTSNIFEAEGGLYTIYVRGRGGCGQDSMEYLHFVIPKFFTPNNDGQNDTFNLKGIEQFSSSVVRIFDRYGKLLIESRNSPFTWDGTFNKQALPTSDYWYIIQIENQMFRGHFTLKR